MGFGTIVGQVLFIFIVIIVVANVIIQNNANVNTYALAKKDNTKINLEKENSGLDILNVTSSGSGPITLSITVKNSGKTILDTKNLDLYIDNSRIGRSSFTVTNAIDIVNPRMFDPDETVIITYDGITTGNHYITVISEFGAKANKIASIS